VLSALCSTVAEVVYHRFAVEELVLTVDLELYIVSGTFH